MATVISIASSLALHACLAGVANIVPDEDPSDKFIAASIDALDTALAIPALTLVEARDKLAAIIAEADDCFVEPERLTLVLGDLDRLLERLQ